MKTFILVTFLSVAAQSQIYFKSLPLCNSWTYKDGGYMCSGFPMSEYIPDQFSLNNKITNLENRISSLEQKIAQMEILLAQKAP